MYKNNRLKFVFDTSGIDIRGKTENRITLDNCKASVKVTNGGAAMAGNANFTIYGLSTELITALCKVGASGYHVQAGATVEVEIYANDSLVYSGNVYYVNADMNETPDVGVEFIASASKQLMSSKAPDYSFKGTRNFTQILKDICNASDYDFVDKGVTGSQTNGYYSGTPLEQIRSLCVAGKINFAVNGRVVYAWNRYRGKLAATRPVVSPGNGLIGYPVYTRGGLTIQTQFSPFIVQGEQLRLDTSLPGASGDYDARLVSHYLTSWTKNGAWHTIATISPFVPEKENGNE